MHLLFSSSSRPVPEPIRFRVLVPFLLLLLLFASSALAHSAKADKTGILLVAFGSSVSEAQVAFKNIDAKVRAAHPGIPVQWAFTSHIIRTKLAKEGKELLSPAQALALMASQGYTHVAVQSLHTIPGEEYNGLLETVRAFQSFPDGIAHIALGAPLLYATDDLERVADALLANAPAKRSKDDALLFMGHGTPHPGNVYYIAMQELLRSRDANAFVATVEGTPDLDQVRKGLKDRKIKKIWLLPFMSVAGDHARNDMSGPESDSWTSILTADGFQCASVLKGTAEYDNIVAIWLEHLDAALSRLVPVKK
ncbi:MAG: sirohydrochlorin cobaltochelatase [Desulfovibrio sp.]